MRFQIIVTPSTVGETHTDAPYGALYIAASLIEQKHDVRIENYDIEKFDYADLFRRIKEYKPDVIGISGVIVMSYKFVKDVSLYIKKEFPNIKIIVGGGVGSAAELLLRNSGVDVIVVGEGDLTIKELAERIASGRSYHDIDGIAFKEDDAVIKTPPRVPIRDLDVLNYPAFDSINISEYFIDIKATITGLRHYKNPDVRLFEPKRSKKMLRILLSRGCISKCAFCYRPTPGFRHFSFDYIFDYIEHLMDKFNINIFSFGDECFAPNKAWNWKFLEELHKRKLDIMFQIMGMRVDVVDYDILRAFKEAGCFIIFYGFESGSQKMLDIMEKKVTVEQNLETARLTKRTGIYTSPNFLFGMPGETTKTVCETIDFLKRLNYGPYWHQYVYALAVPGTPLYNYAKLTGLIQDENKYLEKLFYTSAQNLINTDAFINFTSEPYETVKNWPKLLDDELLKYYHKNKIIYFIHKYLKPNYLFYSLRRFGVRKTLKDIWNYILKKAQKTKYVLIPIAQESTFERNRYTDLVRKFINGNNERLNLRQIIKRIEDDNRAIIERKIQV